MLFPFFAPVLAWEGDATAQVAVEASAVTGVSSTNGYALALAAASARSQLAMRSPRTFFTFDASGRYGRALAVTQTAPPPTDVSGALATRGDFVTSPRTALSFSADGFLASRLGLRVDNDLAARDPFLRNRLVYTVGGRMGFTAVTSPRGTFQLEGGYAQAGALAADSPDAVGLDSHAAHASAAYNYDLTPTDRIGPLVRLTFTHFEHALLDTDLRRGPADVTAATAVGTYHHSFTGRLEGLANLGVTVATPPPILQDADTVVAPEVRLGTTYFGRRYRSAATYNYSYRSLGPRIGFGYEHGATIEISGRPRDGREFRDVRLNAMGRFRYGTAPLAASPRLGLPPEEASQEGSLSTTGFAAGGGIEVPLAVGLMFTARLDLELITARLDPAPAGVNPAPMLRSMLTIALTAIGSTDPMRRVPRDPEANADDRPLEMLREERARNPALEDGANPDPDDEFDYRDDRDYEIENY
jgi:hypothetical protein